MKNRIWVFLVGFVVIGMNNVEELSAQMSVNAWSGYIHVKSYDTDNEGDKQMTFQVEPNGASFSNWSIAVELVSITSSSNKILKGENISIRFNEVGGTGGGNLGDIDKSRTKFKLNTSKPITILQSGSTVLQNNKTHQFRFDIILDKESYLGELAGSTFYLNVIFHVTASTIVSTEGIAPVTITKSIGSNVGIQIYSPLNGIPPSGPIFGFQVNANATLDFTTPEHYTTEVGNDQTNSWVSVISKNSGYVVKVKTNNSNFELIRNDSGVSGDATIPVNVVNVEMKSAGSGTSQGAKALSSTKAETLFRGTKNNNAQKLPVRYFIRKTEAEKLATITSGEYKAILTYTLEPN